MRGEFVDVAGSRLYYYAAGSRGAGEPVVLLHGFPTSGHLWGEVVRHLPGGHRIIVVDLLGYGRSDRPGSARVDIRGHAERVTVLLDALGINFACVVGHDIGGAVALTLALRHADRVSRLGLVSAAAFDAWPTREVKVVRAMLPLTRHLPASWIVSAMRADLLRGYGNDAQGAHSVDRYVRPFADADGRAALFQHLLQLDARDTAALTPRLPDIVQPTAIVWGSDDPFLPAALGERLHAAIPRSSLDIVEGGHHFIPEEAPQAVARSIAGLLSRH